MIEADIVLEVIEEEGIEGAITFYQRLFCVSYPVAKNEVHRIYNDFYDEYRRDEDW